MKPSIGQVVNFRYEILEKTGEGSLFTVFRARDKVMNRLVALKVLKEEYSSDSVIAENVIGRAKILSPVNHSRIARVFDAAIAEDAAYMVEEHVRGIDLKERIRRIAPFTVAAAVDVATALADALDNLHTNGIVHGDLRPQKVLMGPEGEIKLSGAGLSLALQSEEDQKSLALMRAVHYAAPETFEGAKPDERTDLYSLGVILYEMLTGSLPFQGDTAIAVAMKHTRDPVPSARVLNAGVPKAIDGIISKAMAKNPEERYQTARQMLQDLHNASESMRVGKPLTWTPQENATDAGAGEIEKAEPPFWKTMLKAIALVVIVAALAFVGFTRYISATNPPEKTVPNLVGLSLEEARQRLDNSDLTYTIEREEFNDSYEAGQVYFSSPRVGERVKSGAEIALYVSKGSRLVKMPRITGLSEDNARQELLDSGFVVGKITQEHSDTVPAGDIIRQSPDASVRSERGTDVDLVVSLGPEPEPVVQPSSDTDDADTASSGTSVRKLNINLNIPDGDTRRLQIIVKDDTGEWTALDELHEGGSSVATTISATGKRVEIRTLIDGKEVNKQIK